MKKGFTLAEVLITMGIIGVVAALTIPSMSTAYQKRVMTTQLQKSVAELSQAGAMALADEMGEDFRKSRALRNGDFISKYVKTRGSASFASSYGQWSCPNCGDDLSLSDLYSGYDYDCGKLQMGASVCVNHNGDGFLDINSAQGPNLEGRDLFMIGFGKDGTIGDYDHYLRSVIRADWDLDASH